MKRKATEPLVTSPQGDSSGSQGLVQRTLPAKSTVTAPPSPLMQNFVRTLVATKKNLSSLRAIRESRPRTKGKQETAGSPKPEEKKAKIGEEMSFLTRAIMKRFYKRKEKHEPRQHVCIGDQCFIPRRLKGRDIMAFPSNPEPKPAPTTAPLTKGMLLAKKVLLDRMLHSPTPKPKNDLLERAQKLLVQGATRLMTQRAENDAKLEATQQLRLETSKMQAHPHPSEAVKQACGLLALALTKHEPQPITHAPAPASIPITIPIGVPIAIPGHKKVPEPEQEQTLYPIQIHGPAKRDDKPEKPQEIQEQQANVIHRLMTQIVQQRKKEDPPQALPPMDQKDNKDKKGAEQEPAFSATKLGVKPHPQGKKSSFAREAQMQGEQQEQPTSTQPQANHAALEAERGEPQDQENVLELKPEVPQRPKVERYTQGRPDAGKSRTQKTKAKQGRNKTSALNAKRLSMPNSSTHEEKKGPKHFQGVYGASPSASPSHSVSASASASASASVSLAATVTAKRQPAVAKKSGRLSSRAQQRSPQRQPPHPREQSAKIRGRVEAPSGRQGGRKTGTQQRPWVAIRKQMEPEQTNGLLADMEQGVVGGRRGTQSVGNSQAASRNISVHHLSVEERCKKAHKIVINLSNAKRMSKKRTSLLESFKVVSLPNSPQHSESQGADDSQPELYILLEPDA
jgi:hypothetical protein